MNAIALDDSSIERGFASQLIRNSCDVQLIFNVQCFRVSELCNEIIQNNSHHHHQDLRQHSEMKVIFNQKVCNES